jgi:LysM repeat protein
MDETHNGSRNDDPEATGPLWPLPGDDLTRPNNGRRRAASDSSGRPPDDETTTVLPPAGGHPGRYEVDPTRVASDAPRNWLEESLPDETTPPRARAGRPRRGQGPRWTRIVAPVVLLAAILAVFTLTVQSGVIGNKPVHTGTAASNHPTVKPKPKYYRVKSGDTMGTIAEKLSRKMGYTITVDDLLSANPRASSTTINPGQRLKIPPRQ